MKVVFMGTPDFAVPALERLAESRHEVVLVVTQTSKPKGRGGHVADPPVKVAAEARGLTVIQPASLKSEPIDAKVRELGADIGVVAAYGKMLPKALLEAPRLGFLNIHPSLLPEYRGAAPIQRALMDGRLETGVSIMKVIEEMDAGPVVSQQRVEILPDDDARSLSDMLSVLGADMLLRAIDEAGAKGSVEGEEQDHAAATHAPMLTKEEGRIPWSDPSERIMFRLRATTPWPGAFTTLRGKLVKILQAEPMGDEEVAHLGGITKVRHGAVTLIDKDRGFAVKTGDGHLLVTRLQPEGRPEMEGDAFLNGNPLKPGDTTE